jgi:glutathione S-transferase
MLELYHFDRSTAAQKVRLVLAEKGLEWKGHYIETGFEARDQHDPDYLKLNPRGVVPTLVHDGRVIRESNVILEYLEDAFPAHPLRPDDPFERAEMRLWTRRIDDGVHVDSRTVGQCIAMRFRALEADPAVVEKHYADMPETVRRKNDLINNELGVDSPLLPDAIATFKKLFHEIDDTLGDGDWLVGEMFSLADISMVVYVNRLASFQMAPLWNDLVRLKEWNERIRARPTYVTAVTEWGDTTSQKRIELGDQAFPKVKALWDAA